MAQNTVTIELHDIEVQAQKIRDIAQIVLDACQSGKRLDAYVRNKVASGSLAQDAAVLGIYVAIHEMQREKL